ncbi:hypothetical protein MASR2M69_01640 [Bacteroidota bacterium]
MNFKRLLIVVFFTLSSSISLLAQTVSGTVKVQKSDGTLEPMAYASVYWIEGKVVVETDDKGKFSFDRKKAENLSLIATFVGHTKDTIVLAKGENRADFLIKEGEELQAARVVSKQQGNYLSKLASVKTEVISAAGLVQDGLLQPCREL